MLVSRVGFGVCLAFWLFFVQYVGLDLNALNCCDLGLIGLVEFVMCFEFWWICFIWLFWCC